MHKLRPSLLLLLGLILATGSTLADDPPPPEEKSPEQIKKEQLAIVNSICSSCGCDVKTGLLDCSDKNLLRNFLASDFEALNAKFPLVNVFFEYNQIRNISRYPNVSIVTLDLSHNQINEIESGAFADLSKLTELDLSHNRLTSDVLTPQVFQGRYDDVKYYPLVSLKVLKLKANDIHMLDADVFEHMSVLEELDLSENPMMVIDSGTEIAISGIANLKKLNLADTKLRKLPEHIFHAPRSLIEVNLAGNLFQTIPDSLIFAINLETLILDENPIARIGSKASKFPVLSKMKVLSISNMQDLERIENHGLSNLENLEQLNCTDNPKLNFIHEGALSRPGRDEPSDTEWPDLKKVRRMSGKLKNFFNFEKSFQLFLSNNNLSILESDMLSRWDNVEEIDLSNNPWLCDCKTQWMIDILLDKYGKSQKNVKDVICEFPLEHRGEKMVDLEHKTLKCVNFKDGRVSRDGAVFVGILIGALVGVPIALMLFLIYKRGCFGLLSPAGPADFSRAFYKRTAQDDMNF